MTEEHTEALQIGVGVAATCIGLMCSVYHCCCHVWRRLKGHTPAVAGGVAAVAGVMAAGQLAAGAPAGVASGPRAAADPATCRPQTVCPREEGTVRINMVSHLQHFHEERLVTCSNIRRRLLLFAYFRHWTMQVQVTRNCTGEIVLDDIFTWRTDFTVPIP
jgi:hypothetical protein